MGDHVIGYLKYLVRQTCNTVSQLRVQVYLCVYTSEHNLMLFIVFTVKIADEKVLFLATHSKLTTLVRVLFNECQCWKTKMNYVRKIYWKKYERNCFGKLLSDLPWFKLYECSNACIC